MQSESKWSWEGKAFSAEHLRTNFTEYFSTIPKEENIFSKRASHCSFPPKRSGQENRWGEEEEEEEEEEELCSYFPSSSLLQGRMRQDEMVIEEEEEEKKRLR